MFLAMIGAIASSRAALNTKTTTFNYYRRGKPFLLLKGNVNDPFNYYRRGQPLTGFVPSTLTL